MGVAVWESSCRIGSGPIAAQGVEPCREVRGPSNYTGIEPALPDLLTGNLPRRPDYVRVTWPPPNDGGGRSLYLVRPLLGGIACAGYEADRLSGKAEERWEREGAKLAAAMLEVIDLRYDHGIRADVCSRPTQDIGSYPLVSGLGTLNASRTPSAHRLDHLILAGQLVGRSVSPDDGR